MRVIKTVLITAILSIATGSAAAPSFGGDVVANVAAGALKALYKRPRYTAYKNVITYKPQIATLGKMLFFDPRLSQTENVSCATCHNPSFGWETPVAKSIGNMNLKLERHTPTVLNLADAKKFNWEGGETTLREQIKHPLIEPMEMGNDFDSVVKRLRSVKSYQKWFSQYYPTEGLNKDTVINSIEIFITGLQSGSTPFDRWIEGDKNAISQTAQTGFDLFNNKYGCANCHRGWDFTDHSIHNLRHTVGDVGAIQTQPYDPKARFAFKTPGLREIASRAPYMHDGSVKTLENIIDFYATGSATRLENLDLNKLFRPSVLEKQALIAFLKTLTSDGQTVQPPKLPAD